MRASVMGKYTIFSTLLDLPVIHLQMLNFRKPTRILTARTAVCYIRTGTLIAATVARPDVHVPFLSY